MCSGGLRFRRSRRAGQSLNILLVRICFVCCEERRMQVSGAVPANCCNAVKVLVRLGWALGAGRGRGTGASGVRMQGGRRMSGRNRVD